MILVLLILKKKKYKCRYKIQTGDIKFLSFFFFKYVLIQKYIIRTGKEIIRFNEKICN